MPTREEALAQGKGYGLEGDALDAYVNRKAGVPATTVAPPPAKPRTDRLVASAAPVKPPAPASVAKPRTDRLVPTPPPIAEPAAAPATTHRFRGDGSPPPTAPPTPTVGTSTLRPLSQLPVDIGKAIGPIDLGSIPAGKVVGPQGVLTDAPPPVLPERDSPVGEAKRAEWDGIYQSLDVRGRAAIAAMQRAGVSTPAIYRRYFAPGAAGVDALLTEVERDPAMMYEALSVESARAFAISRDRARFPSVESPATALNAEPTSRPVATSATAPANPVSPVLSRTTVDPRMAPVLPERDSPIGEAKRAEWEQAYQSLDIRGRAAVAAMQRKGVSTPSIYQRYFAPGAAGVDALVGEAERDPAMMYDALVEYGVPQADLDAALTLPDGKARIERQYRMIPATTR